MPISVKANAAIPAIRNASSLKSSEGTATLMTCFNSRGVTMASREASTIKAATRKKNCL